MTGPAHADPNSGLLKAEPVVAAHVAAWLVLNAGVLLVSRYHLATDSQWKVASLELTPIVTAVLLAVLAWLVRRVVTPAWKLLNPAASATAPASTAAAGSTVVPDVPTELDGLPPLDPMPVPTDS